MRGFVDAVSSALTETRKAVLDGFYIRPYAERDVRVPGLELPPLMWIFEWDMVGGWHSLLSLVYRVTQDDIPTAIAEGHASADTVRRVREQLATVFAAAGQRDVPRAKKRCDPSSIRRACSMSSPRGARVF